MTRTGSRVITTSTQRIGEAVVYDFSPSQASEHARNFLGSWNCKLVCDDFASYKAGFEKTMT